VSDNRGGAREGAGRKPKTANEKAVAKFEKALRAAKRRHGVGWEERLAEMNYNRKDHLAMQALKLTAEIMVGKQSRQDVAVENKTPPGPIVIPDLYEREDPEEETEELLN